MSAADTMKSFISDFDGGFLLSYCLFLLSFSSHSIVLSLNSLKFSRKNFHKCGCNEFVESAESLTDLELKTLSKGNRLTSSKSFSSPFSAYIDLIGNTPIVRLHALSAATGCNIFAKMESLNPGGTGKDRAVKYMILNALSTGEISDRNRIIVEGTSGSTGISLACICKSLGLQLHIVMPDDQAEEKRHLLETLDARVSVVPACAISNANHYVNQARELAKSTGGYFVNQFENESNWLAHFETTGPEIHQQISALGLRLDAFVMSSGTGGTIAGVSQYLKKMDPLCRIVLADPPGSSLLNKVKYGVCYSTQQAETRVRRHRYDSIVEGVGLDRVTANFTRACIDEAVRVSDEHTVNMARWVLCEEGLFVGSSSALNLHAAYQVACRLGPGHTIITVVCDSGQRHLSRFWNDEYLYKYNLASPSIEVIRDTVQR